MDSVVFYPFAHAEVFPWRPFVIPVDNRSKIINYCIPNAIVIEIKLPAFLNFVSEVSAIGRKAKNHEGFFQLLKTDEWFFPVVVNT